MLAPKRIVLAECRPTRQGRAVGLGSIRTDQGGYLVPRYVQLRRREIVESIELFLMDN